jgi:hypothetical protein
MLRVLQNIQNQDIQAPLVMPLNSIFRITLSKLISSH